MLEISCVAEQLLASQGLCSMAFIMLEATNWWHYFNIYSRGSMNKTGNSIYQAAFNICSADQSWVLGYNHACMSTAIN
jgi:hypothetical protein